VSGAGGTTGTWFTAGVWHFPGTASAAMKTIARIAELGIFAFIVDLVGIGAREMAWSLVFDECTVK
jgi:hypothetical protein